MSQLIVALKQLSLGQNLRRKAVVGGLIASFALASPALAQDDKMTPIPVPAQPGAITLNTGPLPGAKNPEAWHAQYGSKFTRNVTVATLTPFLPDPAKANGTAVIVAPGGGFMSLSMENEGWDVAKALAAKGVAAFVLKYRLNQTPDTLPGFEGALNAMLSGITPPADGAAPPPRRTFAGIQPQLADAQAAFQLVRSRAAEWKIKPDRVGMVGFSAGAMLTLSTALQVADAKPAFIGLVYGGLNAVDVPADAPPAFVAIAADDPFFANPDFGLIKSWRAAKRPIELHFYEQGGHGFGMYPKETTSTNWFEGFVSWIKMHGFMKPAK